MVRVLVVATGRKTRGGITSVIKAHETGEQWKKYHCVWIQTHRDSNSFVKIWYFITALLEFLLLVPFCDIVHFHFSNSSTAKRKRILMPIAKICRKKIIVHFHAFSMDNTVNGPFRKRYEYLFFNADLILVLSGYWKNALIADLGLPENKIRVVYNPCPNIDTQTFVNSIKFADATIQKKILYAGTVCHRKGYDDMIRAFAKIASRHQDWKIVFAGNGEVVQGKALAAELGILNQTEFLGWVSGNDKDKAFRNVSIFCLPSYAEGFPMGVLDAWAYGLPVITTPVGGIPDIAVDGKNMLLFNPGDIEALSCQMERMISDDELRATIANQSVLLANTIFNVHTINQKLGDIYEALLND